MYIYIYIYTYTCIITTYNIHTKENGRRPPADIMLHYIIVDYVISYYSVV